MKTSEYATISLNERIIEVEEKLDLLIKLVEEIKDKINEPIKR